MLGHVDTVSRNLIAGWAANPTNPAEEVFVRLSVNGRRMRVAANIPREDLVSIFPNATGRYGFCVDSELLPLSPFVDHDIEIVFAKTGQAVGNGSFRLNALGNGAPGAGRQRTREPIVLTTTGRSGSSLLMARLADHPGILVGRQHPYELKLLSYHACALRTLTAPADRQHSTDPDTMTAVANRFYIGFNPYNDHQDADDQVLSQYWNRLAPERLRRTTAALIDTYYDLIAERTKKQHAAFFAEKIGTSDLVREATSYMFGATRELVLIRDPRDIICSSKSFWNRGFEESLRSLRGQFLSMTRARSEPGLLQHVVRYEDLLREPEETMNALFGFLGLPPAPPADLQAQADVFTSHGTSKSPQATIGRWRRDFSPGDEAAASRQLGEFIEKFGYSAE